MKPFSLYLVTEQEISLGRSNAEVIESAITGGVSIVQLRQKKWNKERYLADAKILARLCKKNNVIFVINDYIDIALDVGADGVHLGQEDMSIMDARKMCGKKLLIGKSTHSLEQALVAENEGADYISIGPVFETRAKPYTIGVDVVRDVVSHVRIPVVAIGGITLSTIQDVMDTGAHIIAVISGIVSAPDIEDQTKKYVNVLRWNHEQREITN